MIDLIGKRYGRLVVTEQAEGRYTPNGSYIVYWKCKCDCGKEAKIAGNKLRSGHTQSCGCLKKEYRNSNYKNLTGQRFGRLTVIDYIPEDQRQSKQYAWLCRCDCGNETKGCAYKLKNGLQQSCGCLKEEMKHHIGEVTRKYKHSNKRLYGVYKMMHNRCEDHKHREWMNYGGRGIKVCSEWSGDNGYDAFAEWAVSTGYDDKAGRGEITLDRIDTDGDYAPDNCRWVSNERQQNNRRNNVVLEYNGEKHSMKDWSRILNIPYSFLDYHCRKKNETVEQSIIAYGKRR